MAKKCGVLREISPYAGDAIPIFKFLVYALLSFMKEIIKKRTKNSNIDTII
jgi:hypothetical protein